MIKNQKELLYFIQDDIKVLEKNILTFSDKQVDALFNKIASYGLLEESILNALLIVIQKKIQYHEKQIKICDNSKLKYIVISLIISVLSLYGLYMLVNDYTVKNYQFNLFIEQLKPYGITIKEHSKHYYKHTEYWLEVMPPTDTHYQWITATEWTKAKEILDRIYKLHSTMRNKDKWIFRILFCVIFLSVSILFSNIRQWLKPRYKERYEKYTKLENEIKQKIAQLSSKNKIK